MSEAPPFIALHADRLDTQRALVEQLREFPVFTYDKAQELCSALYRDPDLVGLLATNSAPFAAMTIAEFRRADVKNLLMVLVGGPKPALHHRHETLVHALGSGADDAQPLDIDPRELGARLKAMGRRGIYFDHQRIELPNCVYDGGCHSLVSQVTESIRLTATEAKVLGIIARHRGDCVTKEMIFDDLYGGEQDREIKIVDVMICKVRRKLLKATGGLDVIKTVWGRGYSFDQNGFLPNFGPGRVRAAG
jgi:two-component system cell cycle response regulator CtrA